MSRIPAFLLIIFMALSSIPLFVVALLIRLLTAPFDRRIAVLHLYTCFWSSLYMWLMPYWSVKIEGRDKIKRGKTYIIVSNHQSNLDVLVLFRLFVHFKWVSKAEVFKFPFIGWNMYLNRYIGLKRGDRSSIEKMMDDCRRTLKNGSSVFIFPEGTRSVDGNLRPFKAGAFVLAHEMKLPILPIVVNNTKNALPKHSLKIGKHTAMRVTVLDELPYNSFKDKSTAETAEYVREVIARHVVL
jgi:1-acyl-sn-glycerol-3-phosphate acyltransferase